MWPWTFERFEKEMRIADLSEFEMTCWHLLTPGTY